MAKRKNRVHDLVKKTSFCKQLVRLYTVPKALICSKQALISAIIASVITYWTKLLYDIGNLVEVLAPLVLALLGAMIALLAFALAAISIVTSTISDAFLEKVVKLEKLRTVEKILFAFNFSGFLDVMAAMILLTYYFILYTQPTQCFTTLMVSGFFTWYLSIYSIIYSWMLIELCIKIRYVTFTNTNNN